MPRGDGTGPMGRGSMTGRGMGYCVRAFESGEASYIGGGIRRGSRRWLAGMHSSIFAEKKELLEDE